MLNGITRACQSLILCLDGACANYVTVPGFHRSEDAQTGWVASEKLRLAVKGLAGREERGLSFYCKQSWVGFFFFRG